MAAAISPEDLAYPDHPDAAGQARKQYRGETFYFGAHNTPDSIVLFGKWKGKLVETGKPVKPASAVAAEDSAAHHPLPPSSMGIWPTILGAAVISLAILGGAQILSSTFGSMVDGVLMTEHERNLVRGTRKFQSVKSELAADEATRAAKINLTTEGLPDGAFSFEKGNGS